VDGRFEILIDEGELKKLRKRRKELENNFKRLDELEKTLRLLRYRYLLERRDELQKKLDEMKAHYKSLVEFQERAHDDKEFLFELRRELSRENRELEKKVSEGAGGSNLRKKMGKNHD